MSTENVVHTVVLDPAGPPPEMEIIFGQAQVGNYKCYLWETPGSPQATKVAQGNNVDAVVDKFPMPQPPATLQGKLAGFTFLIQAPSPGPGQMYSIVVVVRQNGAVVPGGLIQDAGAFPPGGSAIARLHYVRFA